MYKYEYQQYENSDQYADYILAQAKRNKNSIQTDADNFLLITTLLWEPHLLNNFELYKNLFESFARKKIKTILIINSYYKEMELSNLETEVHYIDYFLWRTYDKVVRQKKCSFNAQWNSNAIKFLILNGKPGRLNRIRLLWKLKELLSKAIWSLHVHSGTWQESHDMLPELTDQQFTDFVKQYNNNPDQVKIIFQENSLHYGGIPFDAELYANSLFRIITETDFHTQKNIQPWLTEKTFITMLNNMPFILAGDRGSVNKLKHMGFKTFENFLPIPNYDNIENSEEKLDAIVTNTHFWINEMKNKEEIQQDITSNYNRLLLLAKKNKETLEKICIKYRIDPARIEDLCSTYDILGHE
tara:strand:- start:85 stop:1152 length:1068 start_codon:yes stop_codon:yes gene_type:complete